MPIMMIGTQRSGSNLLRLMINQLPDVAAPHPPHILQRLMPLLPSYGDLENPENFSTLVDDVCNLVELNPVPWEGVVLERPRIEARCRDRSLPAVFEAVYDHMAEAAGASTWCCKSLANVHYLPEIEAHFGERVKYIYLFRDGRDVAVSFRKAVVGEKHFYHIARDWAEAQRLALALGERVGRQRFFSVSYEELTMSPEQAMRRLCKFLGVEYQESMLAFHQSSEARRAAASSDLWGNVTSPVMRDNSKKFLHEAGPEDIEIFESVAGEVLDRLGYKRQRLQPGEERRFSEDDIRWFDAENERLKQEVLGRVDPEDLERRDRQASFIRLIQTRLMQLPPRPEGVYGER